MAEKFIGVVVAETEIEDCFEFDSETELKAFAKGASYGADKYAGCLHVFHDGDMPDEDDILCVQMDVPEALEEAKNGVGLSRL